MKYEHQNLHTKYLTTNKIAKNNFLERHVFNVSLTAEEKPEVINYLSNLRTIHDFDVLYHHNTLLSKSFCQFLEHRLQ